MGNKTNWEIWNDLKPTPSKAIRKGDKTIMVIEARGKGVYNIHRMSRGLNPVNLGIDFTWEECKEVIAWVMKSYDLRWVEWKKMLRKYKIE